MIIDFHTHIFPEKIAPRTIASLAAKADLTAYTVGTLEGLKASMKRSGVQISVVQPVATKPEQFDNIQNYAASINGRDGIISFGGIHPDTEHVEACMDRVKELGLAGIKLHPDYQRTYADDDRYAAIVSAALDRDLIVLFHAGQDIGIPEPVHGTPQHFLNLSRKIKLEQRTGARVILAHTGSFRYWDQVEQLLVGKNFYMDISFSLPYITEEQLVRIIRRHGAGRILFGTDSPWADQKDYAAAVEALPLTREEREAVMWKNAARLLKL